MAFSLLCNREISIHALREEGDVRLSEQELSLKISIHALREEGDLPFPQHTALARYFYPRPPRGGRLTRATSFRYIWISIHALREEGDIFNALKGTSGSGISIHALREEGDQG